MNALICFVILLNFAQISAYLLSGTMPGRADVMNPSGSVAQQIMLSGVFVLSMFVAIKRGVSLPLLVTAMLPALPFLIVVVASFFWSEYPDLTFRRSAREILELTSFALLALSITNEKKLLQLFFFTFLAILMADIASLAFPALSQTPIGFAGIHGEKNGAGEFFGLALPVFAIGAADRSVCRLRSVAILAVAACAVLLFASQSKTAILALFLAASCVGFVMPAMGRYRSNRLLLPLIYGLCAIALAIVVFGVGFEKIKLLLPDPTLTGRDQVWRYAYAKFVEHPFLGVGYGALWQVGSSLTTALKYFAITWIMNEAHNGYLDVLAQLGYIGLCTLIFFIVTSAWRVLRYVREARSEGLFSFAGYSVYVAAGALFINITESEYFRPGIADWFMVWFLSVFVAGQMARASIALGRGQTTSGAGMP